MKDDEPVPKADLNSSIEGVFQSVSALVRESPASAPLSDDTRLRCYGLFKHVTSGPCDGLREPSVFQVVARAKYRAWNSNRNKARAEAMKEYVELVASMDNETGRKCQNLLELRSHENCTKDGDTTSEAKANRLEVSSAGQSASKENRESKGMDHSSDEVWGSAQNELSPCPIWEVPSIITRLLLFFGVRSFVPRGGIDISFRDLLFAFAICIRSMVWSGHNIRSTETKIKKVWVRGKADDDSDALVGLSVRSILDLYLLAKRFPPNSEVIIVPPITVPGMVRVLRHHQMKIVPVDLLLSDLIEVDIEGVRSAISSKTVAIIVVHPFGMICASGSEMSALRGICDAYELDLIEDCAECFSGLGSKRYLGSPHADLCLFSFGMIKTATAIGGGIASVQDKTLRSEMERLQQTFYATQSTPEYLSRVAKCAFVKCFESSPLLYGFLSDLCETLRIDFDKLATSAMRSFPTKVEPILGSKQDMMRQIRKSPSPPLLIMILRRLRESQDIASSVRKRVQRCEKVKKYFASKANSPGFVRMNNSDDLNLYWLFPILCEDREAVSVSARRDGYDLVSGASQLCCISKLLDNTSKTPYAEQLMSKLLYLPIGGQEIAPGPLQKALQRALDQTQQISMKSLSDDQPSKTSAISLVLFGFVPVAILLWHSLPQLLRWGLLNVLVVGISAWCFCFFVGLAILGIVQLVQSTYYVESSSALAKHISLASHEVEEEIRKMDADHEDFPDIFSTVKIERTGLLNEGMKRPDRVFLTGATGFVGSLLLKDLLYYHASLGIGGGVIVLVRKKRGLTAHERIGRLLAQPMFSFLSEEQKGQLVHVIEGDGTSENMGMNPSDIQRLRQDETIRYVFHCAAAVSFTQDLPTAASSNITPTLFLSDFFSKLKKDVKFIYISTAFVHGGKSGNESSPLPEELYPLGPYNASDLYSSMLGNQYISQKAMHDMEFPNTYTFTKCVCEHLLHQQNPKAVIIRPSIVGPAVESPFTGWSGSKPSTLVAAACLYMGYQWNLWSFGQFPVPCVPVDILTRYILKVTFSEEAPNLGDTRALGSDGSKSDDSSYEKVENEERQYESEEESFSAKNAEQKKKIFHAAWGVSCCQDVSFSWVEFASAITQLGSVMNHFDRPTGYLGLFAAVMVVPKLRLSFDSYERLHNLLVKAPIRAVIQILKYFGSDATRLSRLSSFLDLPLLFFPFMNNAFYFESNLKAPLNFPRERYLFACTSAAHKFVKSMNQGKGKHIRISRSQESPTAYILGGKRHRPRLGDLWWALSQPRGNFAIRCAGFIFRKILRRTCPAVTIDMTSFERIHRAVETARKEGDVVIVLMPTHRSFFDFVLLSYVCFSIPEMRLDIPSIVAADDFERLPLIGWMARQLKAFYIKRNRGLVDPSLGKRIAFLKEEALSSQDACLELFIEGTRSRDGRFVRPKTGFLRCLHQSGGEYVIVPICINYERIPDGKLLRLTQSWSPKPTMSTIGLFQWLKSVALGEITLGNIHIAANSPFRMKTTEPVNFRDLGMRIQNMQSEKVLISPFHIQAISDLLKLPTQTVREGFGSLGCKSWPCGPDHWLTKSTPDDIDTSEATSILLQFGYFLAPSISQTKPEWGKWLAGSFNVANAHTAEVDQNSNISAVADSVARLFEEADEIVRTTRSELSLSGFSHPQSDHLFKYAMAKKPTASAVLIDAAICMQLALETRSQAVLPTVPAPRDSSRARIGRLVGNEECLGFWGYHDAGFELKINHHGITYVEMKGDRYNLGGKPLPGLLPFIESEMEVRIDPTHTAFSTEPSGSRSLSATLPSKYIEALEDLPFSYTLDDAERARHGTGHSQKDVVALREGTIGRIPDAVVWPQSEEHVLLLIGTAKECGWCLVPYGGGTNVSCALRCPPESVDSRLMISVDMKLMNQVLWVNEQDGVAHVQAGITGRKLVDAMRDRGYTIGHEPDSFEFSTLGGWIATKASGMKRSKYGNIDDIVRSVRAVGANGVLWSQNDCSSGIASARVSEGIEVASLMLGSEGCFGIIASAVIRIWPLPEVQEFGSIVFSDFSAGLRFAHDASKLGPAIPSSVRLLDNEQFRLGQALRPYSGSMWAQMKKTVTKIAMGALAKFDAKSVVCATICYEGSQEEVTFQKQAVARLSKLHRGMSLGPSVGSAGYGLTFMIAYLRDFAMTYHFLGESFETFAPWSRVDEVIQATKACIVKEHASRHLPGKPFVGCRVTQLYHEGACVYFYFCMSFDGVADPSKVYSEIEHAARRAILNHGGSLSHHHGVGKIRQDFMGERRSGPFQEAVSSIREGLDEHNIFGLRNCRYLSSDTTQS